MSIHRNKIASSFGTFTLEHSPITPHPVKFSGWFSAKLRPMWGMHVGRRDEDEAMIGSVTKAQENIQRLPEIQQTQRDI